MLLKGRPFLQEVSLVAVSILVADAYFGGFAALQECPTSGLLWSMAIWAEPRPTRKSRSADALRKAADDPLIMCTVARLFWAERKIEKARSWFQKAVDVDRDFDRSTHRHIGDLWGWWLKFERQHGVAVRFFSILLIIP